MATTECERTHGTGWRSRRSSIAEREATLSALILLVLSWAAAAAEQPAQIALLVASFILLCRFALYESRMGVAALLLVGLPLIGLVRADGFPLLSLYVVTGLAFAWLGIAIEWRRGQSSVQTRVGRTTLAVGLLPLMAIALGVVREFAGGNQDYQQSLNLARYWFGYFAIGAMVGLAPGGLQQLLYALPIVGAATFLLYIPQDVILAFVADAYRWCDYASGISLGYGSLNPNMLGYVSASLSVISLTQVFRPCHRADRYAFIGLWLALGFLSVLTHSKGATLSLVAGTTVALLLLAAPERTRAVRLISGAIAAVLLATVLYPAWVPCTLVTRYAEILRPPAEWKSGSYELREQFLRHAINSDAVTGSGNAAAEPTQGVAPGRSLPRILFGGGITAGKAIVQTEDGGRRLVGSHILLVDLYLETGIVGLTLFLVGIVALVVIHERRWRGRRDPSAHVTRAALGGVFSVILVHQNISGGTQGADWLPMLLGLAFGGLLQPLAPMKSGGEGWKVVKGAGASTAAPTGGDERGVIPVQHRQDYR